MTDTKRTAAGTALIAGGAIYFVAELVAAAAWTDPPYSYTHHFISDLGVHGPATVFGQFMYSPLAWVMNTGFFLYGLVVLTGAVLLGRRALVAAATLLAAGSILVALFPGDGTNPLHGVGAFLAFGAGNVLAILLGRAHRFLGVSRRLGRALVASGIAGFVSLAAFMVATGSGFLIGLFERGILYPFLIGFMVLGFALRAGARRRRLDPPAGQAASGALGAPSLPDRSRPVRQ